MQMQIESIIQNIGLYFIYISSTPLSSFQLNHLISFHNSFHSKVAGRRLFYILICNIFFSFGIKLDLCLGVINLLISKHYYSVTLKRGSGW